MDWLYRFALNDEYPDPVEEIDALCTLDANDELAFLLLADRASPPMSVASCGDVVGLCTAQGNRVILHGTAVVAGACVQGSTPPSVQPIYGDLAGRVFCPLNDLERQPSHTLPETILSQGDQEGFLKGQAYVKRLKGGARTSRRAAATSQPKVISPSTMPAFPNLVFPQGSPAFTVVGLDPTAGTWDSRMAEGSKEMPSFALRWDGHGFKPDEQPLAWHLTNDGFQAEVDRRQTILICIDGPCETNGPKLRSDLSGWDNHAAPGTRGGELALSRQGIHLFWTTQNTVTRFEGASRWIARSLVLFSKATKQSKIETHPHGAFTFMWRLLGGQGALPKKSSSLGRQVRLSLLRAFIMSLSDDMVPNHDALDAACAGLVAGLHHLGLTVPFGAADDGGQIWMPDVIKLRNLLPSP